MSDTNSGATNGASKLKVVGGIIEATEKGEKENIKIPPEGAKEFKLDEENLIPVIKLEPNTEKDMEFINGEISR